MVNFFDKNIQNTLSGILFENYIATELVSNKIPLFYWKGKNSSEFEFLIECNNRIIPMDVKKGIGSLTSLKNYQAINKCDLAIKISKNNYGYDSERKILTVPLYEAFMLIKGIKDNKLQDETKENRDIAHQYFINRVYCYFYFAYYFPDWVYLRWRL